MLWFFVWFSYISTASLIFIYIYNFLHIYIVIFSSLCFEPPKIVKEMYFPIGSNKNYPYKSINVLLDLPLQLENS